jgi:hypothetical protein
MKWTGGGLRSLGLTMRTPHGVPPRQPALRVEKRPKEVYSSSTRCGAFGSDFDIRVSGKCNPNRLSCTHIGTNWSNCAYANDTALKDFFTVSQKVTVKEIEVFKIAD